MYFADLHGLGELSTWTTSEKVKVCIFLMLECKCFNMLFRQIHKLYLHMINLFPFLIIIIKQIVRV